MENIDQLLDNVNTLQGVRRCFALEGLRYIGMQKLYTLSIFIKSHSPLTVAILTLLKNEFFVSDHGMIQVHK